MGEEDSEAESTEYEGLESGQPHQKIDLEALALQVYELLKEELWIEKDRQGWRKLW